MLEYRALSPKKVGALFVGLREDSRIKMRMTEQNVSQDLILMAAITDRLSTICAWLTGTNQPASIVEALLSTKKEEKNKTVIFDSVEKFIKVRYGG